MNKSNCDPHCYYECHKCLTLIPSYLGDSKNDKIFMIEISKFNWLFECQGCHEV